MHFKKASAEFFVVFACSFLIATHLQAQALSTGPSRDAYCELYEHRDFEGRRSTIRNGSGKDWWCGDIGSTAFQCRDSRFNDIFSSVIVPSGCHLEVYRLENSGGESRTWSGKTVYYVGDSWNDDISSARCWCR